MVGDADASSVRDICRNLDGIPLAIELAAARVAALGVQGVAARVRDLLRRVGLPVAGPALAPERLMELMALDKKAAKGKTRFVVLESIGRAALHADVDARTVREAIVAAAQ